MRTKTLLLTAALCAAGVATSMAQVYSANVVGYVNQAMPSGFSMIANPLNTPTNTLQSLLAGAPSGTQILKWNGAGFDIRTKFGANWIPDDSLAPGDGAFINLGAAYTNTWVGEVLQGSLTNPIPAGFSIQASQVPQASTLNNVDYSLAAALASGSQVLQWNGAGYTISTKFGANFIPDLTINVAESFFVNTAAAASWNRVFTVQ
jgi:hypothetical protein